MDKDVGNIDLFVTREWPLGCPDKVKAKLYSFSRRLRTYERESSNNIGSQHRIKFESIPLGLYKLEVFSKGHEICNKIIQVKIAGADTHWKGHFQKARNWLRLILKKKKIDSLSKKGIDLLKSIEEPSTKPYDDQTGKGIATWVKGATIGYGHLIANEDWATFKNGISETQALALLRSDLAQNERTVQLSVSVPLSQNQFDALVILAYNIGNQAFKTSSVLRLVNDSAAVTPYPGLKEAWFAWNKSQGKPMPGLTNRRRAEWTIYSKNIYRKW